MHSLIERCAEYETILTVGLEKLINAKAVPACDGFRVGCANGGRVLGLWDDSGEAQLAGNGKATVDGKDSLIAIADGAVLTGTSLQINGNRSAIIIGPGCDLKNVQIKIIGHDCLVAIGAATTWESGQAICDSGETIIIGDDCMISSSVMVRVSDAHSIWEAGGGRRISKPASVVIHPHVWLGHSARVSKGVEIGMGAIIGQMSLVTGKLEAFSIYGGIPARLLRRGNAEWSRTNRYEDIPERFRAIDGRGVRNPAGTT